MRQRWRRKPNKSRRRNIYYYTIYLYIHSAVSNFGRTGVIVCRELQGALCYHFDKIHIYHRPNNVCVCVYMVRVFIPPSRCSLVFTPSVHLCTRSFSDRYFIFFTPVSVLAIFFATSHQKKIVEPRIFRCVLFRTDNTQRVIYSLV